MKIFKRLAIFMVLPLFIIFIFSLTLFGGSGSTNAVKPIDPIATPEKAEEYGMVCSEMGVPWEVVILTDAFYANKQGKKGIEDINPIYTSLEFLTVKEIKEKKVKTEEKIDETEFVVKTSWVEQSSKTYVAKNEILNYAGITGNPENFSPSELITSINKIAEDKSVGKYRYSVEISINPDFEEVLKDKIGLDDENIKRVKELYDEHYISQLYFGEMMFSMGSGVLPDITVGDVTRMDLLKVAASQIGQPYGWGGKSWEIGPPSGPLDCSGFVDWVYIQCFGKSVSGGYIPNGVNISGTAYQFYACKEISESELKIGDIAMYDYPVNITAARKINHVGIYVGKINGHKAFIHCGGKWFGDAARPTGRVGISINDQSISNNVDNINRGVFEPSMKGTRFKVFLRAQFAFQGEESDEEDDDE